MVNLRSVILHRLFTFPPLPFTAVWFLVVVRAFAMPPQATPEQIQEMRAQLDTGIGSTMEVLNLDNLNLVPGEYYPIAMRLPPGEGRHELGSSALLPNKKDALFIFRLLPGERIIPMNVEMLGLMQGYQKYSDVIDMLVPDSPGEAPMLRKYRNYNFEEVGTGRYIYGGIYISEGGVVEYNPMFSSFGFDDVIPYHLIQARYALKAGTVLPNREVEISIGNGMVENTYKGFFSAEHHISVKKRIGTAVVISKTGMADAISKSTGLYIHLETTPDLSLSVYKGHIRSDIPSEVRGKSMTEFLNTNIGGPTDPWINYNPELEPPVFTMLQNVGLHIAIELNARLHPNPRLDIEPPKPEKYKQSLKELLSPSGKCL